MIKSVNFWFSLRWEISTFTFNGIFYPHGYLVSFRCALLWSVKREQIQFEFFWSSKCALICVSILFAIWITILSDLLINSLIFIRRKNEYNDNHIRFSATIVEKFAAHNYLWRSLHLFGWDWFRTQNIYLFYRRFAVWNNSLLFRLILC